MSRLGRQKRRKICYQKRKMGGLRDFKGIVGPGILIAATGVGAGDMVAASKASAEFGMGVAWAVAFGAVLKYFLNEGLAHWQLSSKSSYIEGIFKIFGLPVKLFFLSYLVLWTFFVGAALISACGLAAHAIAPVLSVAQWAMLHSFLGALLVGLGKFKSFEGLMKGFIALMFVALLGSSLAFQSPILSLREIITQAGIPDGSGKLLLGVIGGVGGTLTLLAYGYWIQEKGWSRFEDLKKVRLDLFVAYFLTALFGLALVVLASKIMHSQGLKVEGAKSVLNMASVLKAQMGLWGERIFLLGFWAAVCTSLLGVWQSVPTMFCDVLRVWSGKKSLSERVYRRCYLSYLAYLSLPTCLTLFLGKPVFLIIVYSVVGSLFMPFLSATLLWMNSQRRHVGAVTSGWVSRAFLATALVLYLYLMFQTLSKI